MLGRLNCFKDPGFWRTLDSEMKRLHSKGIGVQKKQAEPFSVLEEDKLWNEGLLGMTSPQGHHDIYVLNVLCFAEWQRTPRPPVQSD